MSQSTHIIYGIITGADNDTVTVDCIIDEGGEPFIESRAFERGLIEEVTPVIIFRQALKIRVVSDIGFRMIIVENAQKIGNDIRAKIDAITEKAFEKLDLTGFPNDEPDW